MKKKANENEINKSRDYTYKKERQYKCRGARERLPPKKNARGQQQAETLDDECSGTVRNC